MMKRVLIAIVLTLTLVAWKVTGAASGDVAFVGARVIDGTDRPPIDNATILVRDGRIAAVGPAARVTIPTGGPRAPLAGKTMNPRLANAHPQVGHTEGIEPGPHSAPERRPGP